jgi:hypothetical protein
MSLATIDYDGVLASAPKQEGISLREFLAEELPYVWLDAYIAMLPHQHNVHRMNVEGHSGAAGGYLSRTIPR